MNVKVASFAFVLLVLVVKANMYNDWVQQNATNLKTIDRDRAAALLNSAPKSTVGVLDALVNTLTPAPENFLDAIKDKNLELQPSSKSIWHNFADGVLSERSSFTEIAKAMAGAWWEYYFEDRSKWKFLDPEMPNVKFLSKDGRGEIVYNIYTKAQVKSGINKGTANQYKTEGLSSLYHVRDMFRFPEMGPPLERDQKIAEYLSSHPNLRDDFIRRAEEMARYKSLTAPGGIIKFTLEEIEKMLNPQAGDSDEIRKLNTTVGHVSNEANLTFSGDTSKIDDSLKEDGVGADLAIALLGDDEAKVKEAQRKFDESLGRLHVGGGTKNSSLSGSSRSRAQADSAQGGSSTKADAKIGVKGWCHCRHADAHVVGVPPKAPYTYSICLTCGKVEKGAEGYKGLMIIDNRYFKGSDRGKADAAQAKLFAIPDGQTVIPGKCACAKPDPLTAGPTRVCITCGLACVP